MTEDKSNFFQKNVELCVLIGLVLMCVAIYAQAVGFQFINYDDNYYVYDNAGIASGFNWNSIRWALTAFHSANWHPLTWISHSIDISLFGKNAGAHHATNVIFHAINAFLAFIVFRKMTGCVWKSAIVAALFAVHPAHVESVAWVSERKDVLSTLFWLLTMLAYFRYVDFKRRDAETQGKKSKVKGQWSMVNGQIYYFLTILLFACGLMSKAMLVTLPFALLLCDFWALERLKKLKDLPSLVVEKLPLFVLSAISAYITVTAQRSYGSVQALAVLPLGTRLINAIVAYAKYVSMLFYPVDLGVVYRYETQLPAWQIFGSVILLVAVTAFCIWQRTQRKYLLMGWLWFLGTLVPVIGIVQVGEQSMADRYTYVPYFGLFIMLVWGAGEIFSRLKLNRIIIAGIVSIVLLALCFLSFNQISYWQNGVTLYSHTLGIGQGNALIKHNFCNELLRENRLAEAEQQCLAAIAESPQFVDSYVTLGVIGVKTGNYENAAANFKKAIELKPDAVTYTNLAVALAILEKPDEAAQNLDKAAALNKKAGINDPVFNNALSIVAASYAKQSRYDKTAEILSRALQSTPERADFRANYALALYFQDKIDEARREIERAIKQSPNQPESYNTLGMILMRQNQREEGIKQFEKAIELKPDYTAAKENLEKAQGKKGK